MARFLVKASEFKNVCKAVNDRKLAELKKEIIEILKKQDENEVKKAIDYFNSQELHYTHLEKSLVSGKWIEKAGYGIGTVRIWKGKKYKKIAPDKWVRVFDKEGRGTNIAIGKLIAKVNKIDNVEDLMAFVMANKQRFVDENGMDLPVLDKLRAAVDARNGNVGSKETSKIENTTLKYDDNGKIKEAESTLIEPSKTARNFKYNKDKLSIDELKDAKNEIDSYIQKLNKEISSLEKIKKENADKLTDNAKANIDGNIAYSKNIINAYTKDKEDCEKLLEEKKNKLAEKKNVGQKMADKEDEAFEQSEKDAQKKYGNMTIEELKEEVKKYKGVNKYSPEADEARKVYDILNQKLEEEKRQNRSEAMKGNKNARKFGTDWEEKRKEIQGKLTENTDKLLEDNDNAKDAYEKLQNHLNKRKADAELYRKYLGNQEEPEDVKDFRKWCDDVIEQYRKEVTNTPSKEIISKWEETAKNTPTEKLEEVYNGKQKVDYTNYYENYIDSTIINTFAKDKDLIFPQPYTMLKDIATRKFDNSDKIRLEIIKKELESRKNKMEKSLFDDFIVDVFAADDEKELEKELYAGETEYNDYSAEQPELFNSTAMKVREALDRIDNQVL